MTSSTRTFFFIYSYALFLLVMSGLPIFVSAATLSITTEKDAYGPGDTFVATVHLSPGVDECVNALEVGVTYPAQLLKAGAVTKSESILSLWPTEPVLDHARGMVTYSGGVPAGYCGRVQGDPGETNITAKIVFTVLADVQTSEMVLGFERALTNVLLNDGLGTPAPLTFSPLTLSRASAALGVNEWVTEVHEDEIPPDPFTVLVHRDPQIFQGKHFLVFGAVDKQSGVHHYEIIEEDPERSGYVVGSRERAHPVTGATPYLLTDQTLKSKIIVRAIDNAGNIEETIVIPSGVQMLPTMPSENTDSGFPNWVWVLVVLFAGVVAWDGYYFWKRNQSDEQSGV